MLQWSSHCTGQSRRQTEDVAAMKSMNSVQETVSDDYILQALWPSE